MDKLYVKIDGKFTEYENTVDMKKALHLDKMIKRQKGIEMQVLEEHQLPQEDKLALGLITQSDIDKIERLKRIADIKSELYNIDIKSIRPARAGETDRLQELEVQAEILRQELSLLEK